jgi:hypothetical protein
VTLPTPTPTPPAGRYGPAAPSRTARRAWIATGVVVAVGLLALVTHGLLANPVSWDDYGYKIVDDGHIRVTFDVTRPKGMTATCTVQALSESFGQVGVQTVTVPPGKDSTVRLTVDVQTAEPAVSGTVQGCERAGG